MDRCFICGGKEKLWYVYPFLGNWYIGVKLCKEHENMHSTNPEKLQRLIDEKQKKERK